MTAISKRTLPVVVNGVVVVVVVVIVVVVVVFVAGAAGASTDLIAFVVDVDVEVDGVVDTSGDVKFVDNVVDFDFAAAASVASTALRAASRRASSSLSVKVRFASTRALPVQSRTV